jgi:hypothetical protein
MKGSTRDPILTIRRQGAGQKDSALTPIALTDIRNGQLHWRNVLLKSVVKRHCGPSLAIEGPGYLPFQESKRTGFH